MKTKLKVSTKTEVQAELKKFTDIYRKHHAEKLGETIQVRSRHLHHRPGENFSTLWIHHYCQALRVVNADTKSKITLDGQLEFTNGLIVSDDECKKLNIKPTRTEAELLEVAGNKCEGTKTFQLVAFEEENESLTLTHLVTCTDTVNLKSYTFLIGDINLNVLNSWSNFRNIDIDTYDGNKNLGTKKKRKFKLAISEKTPVKPPSNDTLLIKVHNNAKTIYSFFKDHLQINSWKDTKEKVGDEDAKIINYVRYPYGGLENAYYWDGGFYYLNGSGEDVHKDGLTELSIFGHEFIHAVTETESALVYSRQSGALDESLADIMGASSTLYVKDSSIPSGYKLNEPTESTWHIGGLTWTPNTPKDASRYMDDPSKDGVSLDCFTTSKEVNSVDVHYSSGIPNLAFVLMTQAGKHPRENLCPSAKGLSIPSTSALGINKSTKVWYRANADMFTSTTTFTEALTYLKKAAKELGFTEAEVNVIAEAWKMVNVKE